MKNSYLFILYCYPTLFWQSIPSNLSTIDTEYLESLPESVRADIEAEIEKNKTDETSTLKRRPSSELYKYETVMEWEHSQRQRNEELNKSERFDLIYSGQCSPHLCLLMNQTLVIIIFLITEISLRLICMATQH